jgi:hypothetical protein
MSDSFNFGGSTFNGPTAFGTNPYAVQHQYGTAQGVEELRGQLVRIQALLEQHRQEVDDPQAVEREIVVIQGALAQPEPDGSLLASRLKAITRNVAAVTGLTEAVAQAYEIVVRHWPF